MATLPGAWCYRVSTGTGQLGVSILWLGEVESLICNFYLNVAAREIVQIHPWDTLACCWDVKQPTNKQLRHDLETDVEVAVLAGPADGSDYHLWVEELKRTNLLRFELCVTCMYSHICMRKLMTS